ncbi:MAG TPA: hypothetical protein VGS03_11740 [Candidatus Polarisedimenticolia bacterium]|nr:hypothetical protein [Candidatus Polarisedimenticolia bacterium]
MTTGVVVPATRARALLVAAILIAVSAGGGPVDAARLPVGVRGGVKVRSQLLLRTGDQAPIPARVPQSFGGTLGFLPDGRVTFVAGQDEMLGVVDHGKPRILLHAGQRIDGCGAIRGILYHAAGADGTLAVFVQCNLGQKLLRVDADSGAATVAWPTDPGIGLSIDGYLAGVAVDDQGDIITRVGNGLDSDTILRLAPGHPSEVLVQTGDDLGAGTLSRMRREPSVAPSGMVAFAALTSLGNEVVAVLPPGGTPRVVLSVPSQSPGDFYAPPFSLAPPAVNASGVVGVLSGDSSHISVRRIDADGSVTGVGAGDPAPGGKTFAAIDWVYPAVEAGGGVIFGARLSGGGGGLYRFDGVVTTPVAEQGASGLFDVGDGSITPLPCSDGAIRFLAADAAGYGVFASHQGAISMEVHAGDPMDESARFSSFSGSGGHLTSGPFMASDGGILFDALTTGHGRSLFVRKTDGTIAPVAIDGDPAPQGGAYVGEMFAFHTIAAGGRVAFVGGAPDYSGVPRRSLFAGAPGQLQRLMGEGDALPWSTAEIESLGPPSRINSGGAIVLPVTMTDGWTFLIAWDGTGAWWKLAATGDRLPDGGILSNVEGGRPGAPLAPVLLDDGTVVFAAETVLGGPALYRTTLAAGLDGAVRLVGNGDPVPGGKLEPFLPQAFAVDGDGRLAFQAVHAGDTHPATYALSSGRPPVLLPNLPPPFPPSPFGNGWPPDDAFPRLAMLTAGAVVHEEAGAFGRNLLLDVPRPSRAPGAGTVFEQTVLVGRNNPSPDGGLFGFGVAMGGGSPLPKPTDGIRSPMRLGSDGVRSIVAVEPTSVNTEILVLFDVQLDRGTGRRDRP